MSDASLEQIRESAERLNAATDRLGEQVRQVEESLEQMGVGIQLSVMLESGEELGYMRIGKKRRIAVKESGDEFRAWSDCRREIKISTIAHLGKLLLALNENIKVQLAIAESAIAHQPPHR